MTVSKYKLKKRAKLFQAVPNIEEKQIDLAYALWLFHNYEHKQIDEMMAPFLNEKIRAANFEQSWLKKAREAQFMTLQSAAQKLGVSRAAFEQYETSEARGTISLQTLRKAAEALGCEIVYGLRPIDKKKFSQKIWEKLKNASIDHPWVVQKPQNLKGKSLAAIAKLKMEDAAFRRKQKWSERI